MAITEGNDKIPTPTSTLGEREHKLSHAEAAEKQNNAARASTPVAPRENSNTTPTPPKTFQQCVQQQPRNMQWRTDPAIDGTTVDNPDDTDGLHWEQARRQGQEQANGFKPQPVAGRVFSMHGPVPPLPTLSSTFQQYGSAFMRVDTESYEILASDIEEFFADYVSQLYALKNNSTQPADETTHKAIRFTTLVVRELRELALHQTKVGCVLDGEPDPFFTLNKIPQILPVEDEEMIGCTAIPLREYYHRLMLNFPHYRMLPPQYLGVVDGFINIGVKGNKHYIIMPEAYVLLAFVGIELGRMQDTQ